MIQNQARTAAPHKTQAGPNSTGLSQFLRKILQIVFNPRCIPFLTLPPSSRHGAKYEMENDQDSLNTLFTLGFACDSADRGEKRRREKTRRRQWLE